MKQAFLLFIGFVFVTTIAFGILIWRQTIKFEKSALAAKRRQEEYQREQETLLPIDSENGSHDEPEIQEKQGPVSE